ncbi:MAG: sigma-54-dependent Fis family transcriptional regulator, partial [Acidobacteriota bacterium]
MSDKPRSEVILVIDDEEPVRRALGQILTDEGYSVVSAGSGEDAIETAVDSGPDAIFLDVWLPGIDGLETLRLLRERNVNAPVIMISGHGTIETAVRATKLGAYDFVEKPVSLERVLLVTANALKQARLERRNRALRAQLRREAEFLGSSRAIERLRTALAEAAEGGPVLLFGEKGTGRRLAARWLALHGPHPEGPFLDVQASALPRERLIRALYGDPGLAPGQEPGRLLLADEGTLYIENADTLPAAVQASLEAGIKSGTFPVPGSRRTVRSEPRLVLALLEAPEKLVEAGKLSGEFLALFTHTIEIPPLRERIADLPDLAERFLDEISREYARDDLTLSPQAVENLLAYDWPGNVGELKRVIERLVLLASGPVIQPRELPVLIGGRGEESRGRQGESLL